MDTTNRTRRHQDPSHQDRLALWFARLGIETTEVERCPDPGCPVCVWHEEQPWAPPAPTPRAA